MSRMNEQKWMPASSRPKDSDDYIVYTKPYGWVFIANYNLENTEWISNDLRFVASNLTYWHELPENPK